MHNASSLPSYLSDAQRKAIADVLTGLEVLPISCPFHRADEHRCISRRRTIPDDFLYILVKGALDCTIGDASHTMHPGEFFMVPVGRPHEATMAEGIESYEVFALHMHIYDETQHRFFERFDSPFGRVKDLDTWIEKLSACACLMGTAPEIGGLYMQQIVTQLLLGHLLQNNPVRDLPVKTDQRIQRVLGVIRRQPEAPWTVANMAKESHLSVSRFRELFNACTSTSPKKYVQRVRLSLARSLLVTKPALTVEQVAERVGISDAHYFHAIYKQQFGETPKCRAPYGSTSSD